MPATIAAVKTPKPVPPGTMSENSLTSDPTAKVYPSQSVPIEISLRSCPGTREQGIDVVFLIDNSGSMTSSDPLNKRFKAILDLVNEFEPTRNNLDRIAIYKFSGMSATQVQSWGSWSATRTTIQNMSMTPSGGTPMAHGMKVANDLLEQSNAIFKLVILLSDGDPTPDNYTDIPEQMIRGSDPVPWEQSLIYQAWRNRILYSTIYLCHGAKCVNEPVNGLLWDIAKGTEYITDNPQGAPPEYYFRVDSEFEDVADAYRPLLRTVANRSVPQEVKIREEVSDELEIDQIADVSFTGDFDATNILDYGSTGATSLEEAYDYFKQHKVFEIHLNELGGEEPELSGEVILKFSVKLKMSAVDLNAPPVPSPAEWNTICLYVNKSSGSYIKYLIPTSGPNTAIQTDSMPQAILCFYKGLSVTKTFDQVLDPELATIELKNFDITPIDWVLLAECPSGFMDTRDFNDDFEFKPFEMLFNNRICPWLAKLIVTNQLDTEPILFEQWRVDRYKQIIKTAYQPALERNHFIGRTPENRLLDPYLCQFWFEDKPINTESVTEQDIFDGYWYTERQNGIFKIIASFTPLTTKELHWKIQGASYMKVAGQNLLNRPVDAQWFDKFFVLSLSYYASTPKLTEKKFIIPNPNYAQVVSSESKPDLYTQTCFSRKNLSFDLFELFSGKRIRSSGDLNLWKTLDSPDITPFFVKYHQANGQIIASLGVSVRVHNCGGNMPSDLPSKYIRVKSIFVPYTGKEKVAGDLNLQSLFSGTGKCRLSRIAAGASKTFKIHYFPITTGYTTSMLKYMKPSGIRQGQVSNLFLTKIKHLLVITTVDIDQIEGEIMLSNNRAVEVSQITPTHVEKVVFPP